MLPVLANLIAYRLEGRFTECTGMGLVPRIKLMEDIPRAVSRPQVTGGQPIEEP
jgi:hypothetical protein